MTQLETLIQTLCPNGVKWSSVDNLIKQKIVHTVSASIKLKRNDYLTEGATPIISQEEEFISGYTNVTDKNITEREYVCFGDHSEHIKFVDFAFVQGADGLKIMYCNQDALSAKYFYYAVSNFYKKHCNYERHFKYLQDLQIPLPPLAVQSEIVRILDKFTLYKSELAAELAARLQQYEYYRDKLLTFDDTVKRVKLGEVANVLRGKRLTKSDLNPEAQYDVYHGGIEPLGKYNAANREGDTVMIINVGASAGCVGYSKVAFWSSDGCFCLSKNDIVNSRFLYYYLLTQEKYLQSKVRKAGIPTLDALVINNLLIPLPPLSEQERIVSILDRFDKLCHDIREGLPAEIDLRQKQYEHYRDKLLTFNQPTPNPSLKGRE